MRESSSVWPDCVRVVNENREEWRLCAVAVVFNSDDHVLVGKRIGKRGSWQFPQGGVDPDESVVEAASREAFEEMGLVEGTHLELIGELTEPNRYRAAGWLAKEGFAGQELRFVLFRCVDPLLNDDPAIAVKLEGLGGEAPEFQAVKFMSLDDVVEGVWEGKKAAYAKFRDWAMPLIIAHATGQRPPQPHAAAAASSSFAGTWRRRRFGSPSSLSLLQVGGRAAPSRDKESGKFGSCRSDHRHPQTPCPTTTTTTSLLPGSSEPGPTAGSPAMSAAAAEDLPAETLLTPGALAAYLEASQGLEAGDAFHEALRTDVIQHWSPATAAATAASGIANPHGCLEWCVRTNALTWMGGSSFGAGACAGSGAGSGGGCGGGGGAAAAAVATPASPSGPQADWAGAGPTWREVVFRLGGAWQEENVEKEDESPSGTVSLRSESAASVGVHTQAGALPPPPPPPFSAKHRTAWRHLEVDTGLIRAAEALVRGDTCGPANGDPALSSGSGGSSSSGSSTTTANTCSCGVGCGGGGGCGSGGSKSSRWAHVTTMRTRRGQEVATRFVVTLPPTQPPPTPPTTTATATTSTASCTPTSGDAHPPQAAGADAWAIPAVGDQAGYSRVERGGEGASAPGTSLIPAVAALFGGVEQRPPGVGETIAGSSSSSSSSSSGVPWTKPRLVMLQLKAFVPAQDQGLNSAMCCEVLEFTEGLS